MAKIVAVKCVLKAKMRFCPQMTEKGKEEKKVGEREG